MGEREGAPQMLSCSFLSLSEAAAVTKGSLSGKDRPIGPVLRTDSRQVTPGDGFIALPGTNTDGHAFIEHAIEKGASYVILNADNAKRLKTAGSDSLSFLFVEDTSSALRKLASHVFFSKSSLREVIAVTGTAGKTTTRECIAAVLRCRHMVHAARESHNTWIGCALTMLEMPLETEFLLLEMGTNHPGEIAEMTLAYPPTTVVITAVGPGHLEGLSTIEGVLEAKMEILQTPRLRRLLYNADAEMIRKRLSAEGAFERIPVGFRNGTYLLKDRGFSLDGKAFATRVEVETNGKIREFSSPLFGPQHAYAIGFAVACADLFDVEEKQVRDAIEAVRPLPGRGAVTRSSCGIWCIDETYNANPLSMKQALLNLSTLPVHGRRYAVLGGMRELGTHAFTWHRSILEIAENLKLKRVILIGGEWAGTFGSAKGSGTVKHCTCLAEVSKTLDDELVEGDAVLLKGSRAYGLETVLAETRCLQ